MKKILQLIICTSLILSSQNSQNCCLYSKNIQKSLKKAFSLTKSIFRSKLSKGFFIFAGIASITLLIKKIKSNPPQTEDVFRAVKNNDLKLVTKIIKKNKDKVNATTTANRTPLHIAAAHGWTKIADFLLSNGAKIKQLNFTLSTPLHLAAKYNHPKIVTLLLEKYNDINIDAKDKNGNTALHIVCKKENKDMIGYLIKYRANINVKNKQNETPLNIMNDKMGNEETNNLLKINPIN